MQKNPHFFGANIKSLNVHNSLALILSLHMLVFHFMPLKLKKKIQKRISWGLGGERGTDIFQWYSQGIVNSWSTDLEPLKNILGRDPRNAEYLHSGLWISCCYFGGPKRY